MLIKYFGFEKAKPKLIPETKGEYYLQNNQFILEVYDKEKDDEVFEEALDRAGMVAKNYQSNVTLYKKSGNTIPGEIPELDKVKDGEIRVNEPLKFDDFAIYQTEFKLDELSSMTFALTNKETKQEYGNLTIDLNNPKTQYKLSDGYAG